MLNYLVAKRKATPRPRPVEEESGQFAKHLLVSEDTGTAAKERTAAEAALVDLPESSKY